MIAALITTISICLDLISLAILFRVIISWVSVISPGLVSRNNPIVSAIIQITEPMLTPIRKALPQTGTVDFSPLVLMFVIIALNQVLARL